MIHGQGPPARSQLLVVVPGELRGQLPFNGGGALELVVDLHAQAPPGLLELGRHVGRPLSGMGSELSHLERHADKTQKRHPHDSQHFVCFIFGSFYGRAVNKKMVALCDTGGLRIGGTRPVVQGDTPLSMDRALKTDL